MINELSQLAPLTHVNISFHLRVVYCGLAALWSFIMELYFIWRLFQLESPADLVALM